MDQQLMTFEMRLNQYFMIDFIIFICELRRNRGRKESNLYKMRFYANLYLHLMVCREQMFF